MIRRSLKEKALPLSELESKHSLPEEPLFNDSSYFLGRGEEGSYMVTRLAFRGKRQPEYWLSFHLEGKGDYELREMHGVEGEGFSLGDLSFTCLEQGLRWNIRYRGKISHQGGEPDCDLDLLFQATRPLVNFKNISHPGEMARVIAAEPWSRDFFTRLKEIKKVHLEQGGMITGKITIDGEVYEARWRSVRDHSWGSRQWSTWKRHVWLGGMLDNGEAFNVSMIAYDFMGQLSAGYLTSGENISYFGLLPAMESFAGDPLIPETASIPFRDRDGKEHLLEMRIPAHFDFRMDDDYYIHEGMGDFILDGVPGLGVAEFGFNKSCYDIASI